VKCEYFKSISVVEYDGTRFWQQLAQQYKAFAKQQEEASALAEADRFRSHACPLLPPSVPLLVLSAP